MKAVLLIFSFLFITSCSKELKYSDLDLWKMATAKDPTIELVMIPESQSERRVVCANYGEGCVFNSVKRIKVRTIELLAIQFESEELAKAEAKRINQYYARNWVFDDVEKEPVLESFVKEVFSAKNPNHLK